MEGLEYYGELIGTDSSSALIGLTVGLLFGFFAQQSRFCLRAACQEAFSGIVGARTSIWLLSFSIALLFTQFLVSTGSLDVESISQLNTAGSISGAIIGGSLFGAGMMLTRGCASRLLILTGSGNLRALVAVVLLAITAQATMEGVLSPLRQQLAALWVMDAESRNLSTNLPGHMAELIGFGLFLGALLLAYWHRMAKWQMLSAVMVGVAIALAWFLTNWHAGWSFDVVSVQGISLVGPTADTVNSFVSEPSIRYRFGTGLVAGVFGGALVAALISRQFTLEVFTQESGSVRYVLGAVLMGFGGTMAGGCAVGAGVTGCVVLSATSWIVLMSIVLSAGLIEGLSKRFA